jgi:subtilisin family serine protease
MTLTPGNDLNETARQRTREQIALLRQVHGSRIIVDTDDDADFTFMCSSDELLINPEDIAEVEEYCGGRRDDADDVFIDAGSRSSNQPPREIFVRMVAPTRRDSTPGDRSLLATLDEMDRDLRPGIATPNHLVHICPRSSQCPATEPTETGILEPWPERITTDPQAGADVRVVVIDGGWYHPTAAAGAPAPTHPWSWLEGVTGEPEPAGVFGAGNIVRKYAGHGTFIAGVVRAMAPKCWLRVLSLPVDTQNPDGGVFEADIVPQLDAALDLDPHIINLSAGCPTRQGHPARAFETWWNDVTLNTAEEDRVVFVAAAGNNASPWPFWPASFDWAVGVGSLDHDGAISSFSNWGDSVDVFALGRNLRNAFPEGTYICQETPDRHDERKFGNSRARWSGTSFSAPLVTGLIAAEMSHQAAGQRNAQSARAAVLAASTTTRPALEATTVPVLADQWLSP